MAKKYKNPNIVWSERKRIFCGLPWTFTKYSATEDKLIIDSGFLNTDQEEIRLYRILDFTLRRSFGQRIFGLGTIHCCSADKNTPEFNIVNIKHSQETKDMLSQMVENERDRKHVSSREFMQTSGGEDEGIDDDDHDDVDDNAE